MTFQIAARMKSGEKWEGWRFRHLEVGTYFHIYESGSMMPYVKTSERYACAEWNFDNFTRANRTYLRIHFDERVEPCLVREKAVID